jgi:hypothetical protein
MALDANDLRDDILADTQITDPIPGVAQAQFEIFITRLSIHITEQIKRGEINDVKVDDKTFIQNNTSNVK